MSNGFPLDWNDVPEMVGQMIDGFEDFLEERHVHIYNPEKEDSDDPAILYGTDYGQLQSYLEDTLISWGLLSPPPQSKSVPKEPEKKQFEICYKETLVGYFDVEATDETNAIDEFWRLVETGEIDLLDTEILESEASVV